MVFTPRIRVKVLNPYRLKKRLAQTVVSQQAYLYCIYMICTPKRNPLQQMSQAFFLYYLGFNMHEFPFRHMQYHIFLKQLFKKLLLLEGESFSCDQLLNFQVAIEIIRSSGTGIY